MAAAAHCVAEVVAADVASWPELPEAHAFVSCLPLDCDEGRLVCIAPHILDVC